jgi:hypothetical protein
MKSDLRSTFMPIVGGAIAIAYGGTAIAFTLVAIWPLLPNPHFSAAIAAWLLDLLLGCAMLAAAFATLLRSNSGRLVLVAALIVSGAYELVRTTLLFPSLAAQSDAERYSLVTLFALMAAVILLLSPSSVRYTRGVAT